MLNIAICGAAGRMGKRLAALAHQSDSLRICGAVEAPQHPSIGSDAGELAGLGHIGVPIEDNVRTALAEAGVVIAFTDSPDASIDLVRSCSESGTPFVIGTTGFTEAQDATFAEAARGIPVVKAANFSVGITVLLQLVEEATRMLGPGFDCEIIESHHTRKRDAPSGTAISLARAAAAARGWHLEDVATHGREGLTGERPEKQIGLHAVRAGDIVGHHTVLFGGTGETLELVHRAQSRDTFAAGALRAAGWVVSQPAGLYAMRDVLGLG